MREGTTTLTLSPVSGAMGVLKNQNPGSAASYAFITSLITYWKTCRALWENKALPWAPFFVSHFSPGKQLLLCSALTGTLFLEVE